MKSFKNYLAALMLACGATAAQAIVIDFDALANGVSVDSSYAGITFTGAIVRDDSNPVDAYFFPPHSGANLIYDLDSTLGGNGAIRVDAAGSWTLAGAYVTGNTEIFLEAYDSSGNLLGSQSTGGPNFEGFGTPNIFLSVSAPNIAYVLFHDSGNTFTLDDFTYDVASGGTNPVPDAGSTSLLVASALCGLGLLRRKLRVS